MIDSTGERDPLEWLADEFATRCRNGESPSVAEYADAYPQYAEQIQQLFPTVAMLEQLRVNEQVKREAAIVHTTAFSVPDPIGDFHIIREIGRGGMGVVYEAEQVSLARRVAVKVLPQHILVTGKRRARFQHEARMAGKLQHTNIVPVYGVGEQDDLHYYVMPLVCGVGLDEVIQALRSTDRRSPPPAPGRCKEDTKADVQDMRALVESLTTEKYPNTQTNAPRTKAPESNWAFIANLGIQAADALEHAHRQGTLHRDIKPGNLLVDALGSASLADFGLARAMRETGASETGASETTTSETTTSEATANEATANEATANEAMLPAQPCEPSDARPSVRPATLAIHGATVDMPSNPSNEVVGTPRYMAPEQQCGITDARSDIYSLGMTLYELLTLRDDSTPIRPRAVAPTIPRDLEAIVLKCLAHDPTQRYQTAAELSADLRLFVQDRPARARRASLLEHLWRWRRRNPALAAVSASAIVLVMAMIAISVIAHMQTRTAFQETQQALSKAGATSDVALQALEGIYLQLSPERVWTDPDSDPVGQACACFGLRSAQPPTPEQRNFVQVQVSEQTAALLENLLGVFDRLAEQGGDDAQVLLESAIATRRVGDIRQRLGHVDRAHRDYLQAIRRLEKIEVGDGARPRVYVELARSHNEIGNIHAARSEPESAFQAHLSAMTALQSVASPEQTSEEYRYELARTYFLLGSRYVANAGNARSGRAASLPKSPFISPFPDREYRNQAIHLLEALAAENPNAPDYRFLLALCYRPRGLVPERARESEISQGRKRALDILETLKSEYPQVADYRYELAATYAWIHVGLFPWQEPMVNSKTTGQNLRNALAESQWLVDHNPTIPHYARCKALVLAKLAIVSRQLEQWDEAVTLFEQALETQTTLVERSSDLPDHDRVLAEFFRYRVAETQFTHADGHQDNSHIRALLQTCVLHLEQLPENARNSNDQLASSTLELAREMLIRVPGQSQTE